MFPSTFAAAARSYQTSYPFRHHCKPKPNRFYRFRGLRGFQLPFCLPSLHILRNPPCGFAACSGSVHKRGLAAGRCVFFAMSLCTRPGVPSTTVGGCVGTGGKWYGDLRRPHRRPRKGPADPAGPETGRKHRLGTFHLWTPPTPPRRCVWAPEISDVRTPRRRRATAHAEGGAVTADITGYM